MRIDAAVASMTEATIRSLHRLEPAEAADVAGQIISAASLAEALVGKSIDLLVDESGIKSTRLGRRLIQDSAESYHQTWDGRYGILRDAFGVQLAGNREAQRLNVVVDVRNAIVHGEGQLTSRQTKKLTNVLSMRRQINEVLESEVQGKKIVLSPTAGRCAIRVASDYALAFDAAIGKARLDLLT
ncbi:hypothetical protein GMA12_15140 [Kocuria sediminis]|uniref:RiboL-PSP-HEPN domain-containing protein n=1 Tax=Kocuria sediminis TaxID=1038857 RepID=A0A6N8GQ93_9MICC|nr:hypothetical protein [Kocuria sediminis]MUN64460.1 hypothetical protein [Kocuria sediminis]